MSNIEPSPEALPPAPVPNAFEIASSLGETLLPGAVSFGVVEETRGTKPKAMDEDLSGGSQSSLRDSDPFVD